MYFIWHWILLEIIINNYNEISVVTKLVLIETNNYSMAHTYTAILVESMKKTVLKSALMSQYFY